MRYLTKMEALSLLLFRWAKTKPNCGTRTVQYQTRSQSSLVTGVGINLVQLKIQLYKFQSRQSCSEPAAEAKTVVYVCESVVIVGTFVA